ncbi:MAG TPA: DNA polymerase III subunit delta [Actinomycetota bacterium]|nr:DNA polymerase III subunit delta [Actinomycetota bacterium]
MSPSKATKTDVPIQLLWGEDAFLLREAGLAILGDLRAREIDGADWQGGELADLATPSLFGERRALLVSDARGLSAAAVAEIKAYATAPDPDARLIMLAQVGERAKAPASLAKAIDGAGAVVEVKVARKDLPGWILQRAKERGVPVAPDAAPALVDTLGEDPAALDQAVTQLASAFAGERITSEIVRRQFRGLGEQHVWDLCDRAFGRDLAGAMRSLRTLLEGGGEGLPILGGISSRLRDLIRVRSLPDRTPPADVARAAGLRFEWQARRYREQARRFSLDELVAIHERVAWADRALKSGATDDIVLPIVVAAIAGAPALVGV